MLHLPLKPVVLFSFLGIEGQSFKTKHGCVNLIAVMSVQNQLVKCAWGQSPFVGKGWASSVQIQLKATRIKRL